MEYQLDASHLITFLTGALTGATGKYLADKFTDQRRQKETSANAKNEFMKVANQMPDIISEMKKDFLNPDIANVRELVVLPNKRVIFNTNKKLLNYFEEEHNDLFGKMAVLENHGYISKDALKNVPTYRITEQFRMYVLESKL